MASRLNRIHPDFRLEMDKIKKEIGIKLSDPQASKLLAERLRAIKAVSTVKEKRKKWLSIETRLKF